MPCSQSGERATSQELGQLAFVAESCRCRGESPKGHLIAICFALISLDSRFVALGMPWWPALIWGTDSPLRTSNCHETVRHKTCPKKAPSSAKQQRTTANRAFASTNMSFVWFRFLWSTPFLEPTCCQTNVGMVESSDAVRKCHLSTCNLLCLWSDGLYTLFRVAACFCSSLACSGLLPEFLRIMRSGVVPQLIRPEPAHNNGEHPYLRSMQHRGGGYAILRALHDAEKSPNYAGDLAHCIIVFFFVLSEADVDDWVASSSAVGICGQTWPSKVF